MEGESFWDRKQGVVEAARGPWIIWGVEGSLEQRGGAAPGDSGAPAEASRPREIHRNPTLDPPPSDPEPAGSQFHERPSD